MKFEVLKCHGSGNDFLLIDEYNNDYNFTEEQRVILSKTLCFRDGILGADGILFFQKSSVADGKMRIFNADGTEPEMCGNGLRCVARYAWELIKKDEMVIETLKENLIVKKVEDIYENIKTFQVKISPVSFKVNDLPMNFKKENLFNEYVQGLSDKYKFTAVSLPNPHIISIVNEIDEDELVKVAQKANTDRSIFPRGVNVSLVKPLGEQSIYVQTYERGVGLTNACGTGMSASSLVSCMLGLNKYNEDIKVLNKGGMVKCNVLKNDNDYAVLLIGNATFLYKGEVDFDFNDHNSFVQVIKEEYDNEVVNYSKLVQFVNKINKTNV